MDAAFIMEQRFQDQRAAAARAPYHWPTDAAIEKMRARDDKPVNALDNTWNGKDLTVRNLRLVAALLERHAGVEAEEKEDDDDDMEFI